MISEERLEQALIYLSSTDEEAAELKADVERTEYKAKAMKAAIFSHLEGTVADREAKAMTNPDVGKAYEAHFKAIRDYQAVANKRVLETLVVDVYRTISANRRVGNV